MARESKPFVEATIEPKRRSKRGVAKIIESEPRKFNPIGQRTTKPTKCAICGITDLIAKPYLGDMGSVHPKCHDEENQKRYAEARQAKLEGRENFNEEEAKKLGYPKCIICGLHEDLGDKIFAYSDTEIADGLFKGSVHRSCFENWRKERYCGKS